MKTGVLLTQLGTPESPRTSDVRRYLREFLGDPRVIDLPWPARFLLVNGLIAPFRAPQSARAYASIWTEQGSPLLVHSLALRDGLRECLGDLPIELGMRYGRPSLGEAMEALEGRGCSRWICLALFPQGASSSTGSALEEIQRLAGRRPHPPVLDVIPPFHGDGRFLGAEAAVIRGVCAEFEPDHLLLSFHGLPESHCTKGAAGQHCLKRADCCDRLEPVNRDCYRAQCFATARALRGRLDMDEETCSLSFQSRLGRRPWIGPHTDRVVLGLARAGVRRLAVACPSFVADCLETLEEIGMRAAEAFRAAGGEELRLVPALNADPQWTRAVGEMIAERL